MLYGFECKAYYGEHGANLADLVEIPTIQSTTLSLPKDKTENTPRGAGGWKTYASKVKDLTIQLTMDYNRADAAYTALENGHIADEPLAMAFLDEAGGVGPFGDFNVTDMTIPQNVNDLVVVTFELKPAYLTRPVVWTDGSGGGGG